MNELALFAGCGGGLLASHLLGWKPVCAVEIDKFCRRVLLARQRDGALPRFPIWDDIKTFSGVPWRGRIDIVTGGFPCQDVAALGTGDGLEGERSGLWSEMARVVHEVRPHYVFVENSPILVRRGLGRILSDLADMGYDARWGIVGAHHAGFPHRRDRCWLVGYPISTRPQGLAGNESAASAAGPAGPVGSVTEAGLRLAGWKRVVYSADCDEQGHCPHCDICYCECDCIGPTEEECDYCQVEGEIWGRRRSKYVEPDLVRVANGVPHRMDRIASLGNGQVPSVAALAFRLLTI